MFESCDDDLWQSEFVAPPHKILERKVVGHTLVTLVELEGSVSEFTRPATEAEVAFFGIVSVSGDST